MLHIRPAPGTAQPGFVPQLGFRKALRSARAKLRSFLSQHCAFPPRSPLSPGVQLLHFVPVLRPHPFAPRGVHRCSSWLRPYSVFFSSRVRFAAPSSRPCIAKKSSLWLHCLLTRCYSVASLLGSILRCAADLPSKLTAPAACVYARPAGRLALRCCHGFCSFAALHAQNLASSLPRAGGRPRAPRSSSRFRSPLP